MRKITYTVPPEDEGIPLRALLGGRLHLSKHRIASLKFSFGITVDSLPARTDTLVRAGQTVCVTMEDVKSALVPYDIPLGVLYRDSDLLIVNKPAPLPSISSAHQSSQTLENAVFAFLGCPERFVYRPVSRLDKGTSGLMPVALNPYAQDRLQRTLHTANYVREYLAVTEGAPKEDAGVIDLPIGRENGVKRCIAANGKPACTHFRVLERTGNGRALIRLRLETGRTHQIRVHLAALRCPVAGDYLYGAELPSLPGRFALHAADLAFVHPVTGEKCVFHTPLPDELKKLLEK